MIGVFDSRYGGLTVMKALAQAFPELDFVYLGDAKHAPYGARPEIDVLTLSCVGVDRLFANGCDLVLVVCNTASSVALPWIQQQWLPSQMRPGTNVLGCIVPMVEATFADGPVDSIALFGTERTVHSGAYLREIENRHPGTPVFQQICPSLVRMIDAGADEDLIRAAVHRFVGEMHVGVEKQTGRQWPSHVILGCTHYPLVRHMFEEVLPPGVKIVDQLTATAPALRRYLEKHPEFKKPGTGKRLFLTTQLADDTAEITQRFWGSPVEFKQA